MEWAVQKRNVTVEFAKLRNFNNIINILSLEETHQFLNDYYSTCVEIALAYDGFVSKYMGDAVLTVFGMPSQHDDDPMRAFLCARDIQRKTEDLSVKWRNALDFLIEIDIGISSGEMMVGNVGHFKKMEYTVIGNKVVIAEALAGMCAKYNVEVLLDRATYEEVREHQPCRMVVEALLRGFPEPVALYTPVKLPGS
jgi:adenylate cyclase